MHRAQAALALVARDYPDCWKRLDQLVHDVRGDGIIWPSWCWAPMAAAYAVVSGGGSNRVPPERVADVGRLAALAAWRPTQGIYRFDEVMLEQLWTSELDGALPVEVLTHLPEWCVYLETPGRELLGWKLHGAWVHLEADSNDGHVELRFLLDTDSGLIPLPVHLGKGRGTLAEGAEAAIREAASQLALHGGGLEAQMVLASEASKKLEAVRPLVSLALYLCAVPDDVADERGVRPKRPEPRPGRRGEPPRYFPAERVTVFFPGRRVSAQLRAAGAGGASPRSHVRRAHWHTYVLGPRAEPSKQRREVRWLPPIFVKADGAEVEPVVRCVLPEEKP